MPVLYRGSAVPKGYKPQVTSLEILYTTRNTPIPVTATTWSKIVIEKLNVGQVVEKLPKFYSTRRYNADLQELAIDTPPLPS